MGKRNKRRQGTGNPITVANDKGKPTPPPPKQAPRQMRTRDAFSNSLARLGFGTPNLLEGTDYVPNKITSDIQKLNTLYREHWLISRIINTIPEDMIKNWYKLDTQLQPDSLTKFRRLERTTKLRAKILEGLLWGRLYGGAAGVIVIDGHEDILDEPLELDEVMPGSFKGLIILDRYNGITPTHELVTDINDPDFGLPEYYTIQYPELGRGEIIHHSRIVRFLGCELPYIDEVSEMYWGSSEIERIYDELKKRDNTSWNIAMLIFRANVDVLKLKGMEEIATMDEEAFQDLYDTLLAQNWMKSNQGLQVIGPDDGMESHQYTFAGLSDVMELFMLDIAGASGIPVTKLFGRSPAGMNATGESDMQNYYDMIEEKQESDLRPVFDKLLPIMSMSIFGSVPDDLEYSFNPCRRPTEAEKKNLFRDIAQGLTSLFTAGGISQRILLKELRQSSEITGIGSNITDEDIENADGSLGASGEDMPPELAAAFSQIMNAERPPDTDREEDAM